MELKFRLTGRFSVVNEVTYVNVVLNGEFYCLKCTAEFAPLCTSKGEIVIASEDLTVYEVEDTVVNGNYTVKVHGEFSAWKSVAKQGTVNSLRAALLA